MRDKMVCRYVFGWFSCVFFVLFWLFQLLWWFARRLFSVVPFNCFTCPLVRSLDFRDSSTIIIVIGIYSRIVSVKLNVDVVLFRCSSSYFWRNEMPHNHKEDTPTWKRTSERKNIQTQQHLYCGIASSIVNVRSLREYVAVLFEASERACVCACAFVYVFIVHDV